MSPTGRSRDSRNRLRTTASELRQQIQRLLDLPGLTQDERVAQQARIRESQAKLADQPDAKLSEIEAEIDRLMDEPGNERQRAENDARILELKRRLETRRRRRGKKDANVAPKSLFNDEGLVTASRIFPIFQSLADRTSVVGEALRLLGARVEDLRRQRRASCLALTSPLPGEGKSTLALGLACALAREAKQKILLIEADLRRPSITSKLGIPPSAGLGEWLGNELDVVPLKTVKPGGFSLLSAGRSGLDHPETLGSQRMDALLRAARETFDFVLLDAIPLLPVADAILMQDLVDGFLLVVRSRHTPRDAVQEALAELRPDRVLGVILNDHVAYEGSYRSHGYRTYGMSEPGAGSLRRNRGR